MCVGKDETVILVPQFTMITHFSAKERFSENNSICIRQLLGDNVFGYQLQELMPHCMLYERIRAEISLRLEFSIFNVQESQFLESLDIIARLLCHKRRP